MPFQPWAPLPDLGVEREGVVDGAGIEHDEPVAGIDGVRAGKALVVEEAGGDLLALGLAPANGVDLPGGDLAVPDAFCKVADVSHGGPPWGNC